MGCLSRGERTQFCMMSRTSLCSTAAPFIVVAASPRRLRMQFPAPPATWPLWAWLSSHAHLPTLPRCACRHTSPGLADRPCPRHRLTLHRGHVFDQIVASELQTRASCVRTNQLTLAWHVCVTTMQIVMDALRVAPQIPVPLQIPMSHRCQTVNLKMWIRILRGMQQRSSCPCPTPISTPRSKIVPHQKAIHLPRCYPRFRILHLHASTFTPCLTTPRSSP